MYVCLYDYICDYEFVCLYVCMRVIDVAMLKRTDQKRQVWNIVGGGDVDMGPVSAAGFSGDSLQQPMRSLSKEG